MSNRNVLRIARVLELIASRRDGLTLSEIATTIAAPLSSVRDLLDGLVETGFVERVKAAYVLGPLPFVLSLHSETSPAAVISHRDLEKLAAEGGFTVLFAIRIADELVIIDEAGDHPYLQHLARTRSRMNMLASIAGKVYLAALDDDDLHRFLRDHPSKELVGEFLHELADIRETGVTRGIVRGITPRIGYPGNDTGVICAAIRNHFGRPSGVVVIGHDPDYFNRNTTTDDRGLAAAFANLVGPAGLAVMSRDVVPS